MKRYRKTCGRISVEIHDMSGSDHPVDVTIASPHSGNMGVNFGLSVEELRDFRHLLDRAIAAAETT